MRRLFFIFVSVFFTAVNAQMMTVDEIRNDYYKNYRPSHPEATLLSYAQHLTEEKGGGYFLQNMDIVRFDAAKRIIRGEVWKVSNRAATQAERRQYSEIIAKVSISAKFSTMYSLPKSEVLRLPAAVNTHQQIVDALFELSHIEEAVLFNPKALEIARSQFSNRLSFSMFNVHVGMLTALVPFKDEYFRNVFVASIHKKFIDHYEAFYKKPIGERGALEAFNQYLSDHFLIIERDPKTGIVYVSWNIAAKASTGKERTNNGFALSEDDAQYKARLSRVAEVLADVVGYFGSQNTVVALQELTEGYEDELMALINAKSKSRIKMVTKKTLPQKFGQAIIYDENAFTVEALDTPALEEPYKTEAANRIMANLLKRIGFDDHEDGTALFNLHLDWTKVNLAGDGSYQFDELVGALLVCAGKANSIAIMGDTNYDGLLGFKRDGFYKIVVPPDTSVAASSDFIRGRLKSIDIMILPTD